MLGQAEGRTADDAAYWLAAATPAWRDAVRVAAIDMCTIYLAAVRRMLPHAAVAVDLFHVVQLAVKTTPTTGAGSSLSGSSQGIDGSSCR